MLLVAFVNCLGFSTWGLLSTVYTLPTFVVDIINSERFIHHSVWHGLYCKLVALARCRCIKRCRCSSHFLCEVKHVQSFKNFFYFFVHCFVRITHNICLGYSVVNLIFFRILLSLLPTMQTTLEADPSGLSRLT